MPDPTPFAYRPLAEGRDYYVEDGRWVFTAEYLRARGYCCQSGCRHCPYGFRRTPPSSGQNPAGTSDPPAGTE